MPTILRMSEVRKLQISLRSKRPSIRLMPPPVSDISYIKFPDNLQHIDVTLRAMSPALQTPRTELLDAGSHCKTGFGVFHMLLPLPSAQILPERTKGCDRSICFKSVFSSAGLNRISAEHDRVYLEVAWRQLSLGAQKSSVLAHHASMLPSSSSSGAAVIPDSHTKLHFKLRMHSNHHLGSGHA